MLLVTVVANLGRPSRLTRSRHGLSSNLAFWGADAGKLGDDRFKYLIAIISLQETMQ